MVNMSAQAITFRKAAVKEQSELDPLKVILVNAHLMTRGEECIQKIFSKYLENIWKIYGLLKESVAEDGDKRRETNEAVEHVAEGEMEEEQNPSLRHPWELAWVAKRQEYSKSAKLP